MSVSDPIADMLTSIRNANMARKETVQVPHSNIKEEIAKLLKREGYTQDFTVEGERGKRVIRIYLKYGADEEPIIKGLKRVSTPGRRQYVASDNVPRVLGGIGTALVSTSGGILTDREARSRRMGGEVLCYVW